MKMNHRYRSWRDVLGDFWPIYWYHKYTHIHVLVLYNVVYIYIIYIYIYAFIYTYNMMILASMYMVVFLQVVFFLVLPRVYYIQFNTHHIHMCTGIYIDNMIYNPIYYLGGICSSLLWYDIFSDG